MFMFSDRLKRSDLTLVQQEKNEHLSSKVIIDISQLLNNE